jgi:hypothetical protein
MPEIAEVKLSSCGLQKKLRLRNCGVVVAEQHSFKSCGIAIAEVLPSSCGIAIAEVLPSSCGIAIAEVLPSSCGIAIADSKKKLRVPTSGGKMWKESGGRKPWIWEGWK